MPNDVNLTINRGGNEWQNLANGILQGGAAVANGLIQKNQNEKIQQDYSEGVDFIKNSFNNVFQQSQDIVNGIGAQQEGKRQPIAQEPNPKYANNERDIYAKMVDASMKLNREGGNNEANALERLYSGLMPKHDKPEDFTLGDSRYRTNQDGTITELVKNQKEQKKTYNAGDYNKMTIDDTDKLTDTELDKGFDYFSEDTKNKLFEKYPELKKKYDDKYNEGQFTKAPGIQ